MIMIELFPIYAFSFFVAINQMICMELSSGHRYERIPKSDRSEFAEPHSKPWMAVLLSKLDNDREDYAPCGAALISRPPYTFEKVENGSSDILITAAHCVVSGIYVNRPQRVFVLFGKHDTSKYENSEIRIGVKSIIYKEGYKIFNTTYDIAMLKLEKPVAFNEYIKPIPLSNFTISDVDSCSVSGWGISDSDTLASKYGLGSNLTTAEFPNLLLKDNYIRQKYSEEITLVWGDSGSPLTCEFNGMTVMQGVASGSKLDRDSPPFHYHEFVSVPFLLPWIMACLHKIDSLPAEIYHEELAPYTIPFAKKFLPLKELEWRIQSSTGYKISPAFDQSLNFSVHGETNYLQLWLDEKISEQFYVSTEVFFAYGIQGYTIEENIYYCSITCYLNNRAGACSYVSPYKRCYLSDSTNQFTKSLLIPFENSVLLRFGSMDDQASVPPTFEDQEKIPNIGETSAMEDIIWNVSVSSSDWIDFHCNGELYSSDGIRYDSVELSESCLNFIRMFKNKDHFEEKLNVDIVALPNTNRICTQAIFQSISKNNRLELVSLIDIPEGYGRKFGRKSEPLLLDRYDPSIGGFKSTPFNTPWLVHIFMEVFGPDELICTGFLIDEMYSFDLGEYENQTTKYLLTASQCLEYYKFFPIMPVIIDGAMSSRSIHRQEYRIKKFVNHQSGISIVQLDREITLNAFVQPILLPIEKNMLWQQTSQFMIVSSTSQPKQGVVYEIPVRILNQSNNVDAKNTFFTERIHYHDMETITENMDMLWYTPLVSVDQHSKRHILHGLTTALVEKTSTAFLERHIMIEPYVQWIQDTITGANDETWTTMYYESEPYDYYYQ